MTSEQMGRLFRELAYWRPGPALSMSPLEIFVVSPCNLRAWESSMRRTALCLTAIAFLCVFRTGPAQAQSRVFVAAQGLDSNPCTFAQPCRSFQKAHDTVVAGGEIDVLDPAGYGAVLITKAISIQGHGFAGLAVPSGDGITVNALAND